MKEYPDHALKNWPLPEPLWPDPPWRMEGSILTAWFHTDPSVLAQFAHADFPPERDGRQTRLRFYDITARADGQIIVFREAVLAFKTRFADVAGELSFLMWTDSLPYLSWGREVFGWPLRLSNVELSGGAWHGDYDAGADCRVEGLRLTIDAFEPDSSPSTGRPPVWITPHRVVGPGDPPTEIRRVYGIRPVKIQAGHRFRCKGAIDVRSVLGPIDDISIDFVSGGCIEVGVDSLRLQ